VKRPLEDDKKWVRGNSCGLERSLNILRTDAIVFNTVHDTLTHPEKLCEAMKNKLMESGNNTNRKRLGKRENVLLRDKLERTEIALCDVETDHRLGQIDQSIYDKLINKLTISRRSIQDAVEQSSLRLSQINNTDYQLNKLLKLRVVRTGNSDTDKRQWLERYTRRIDVRYDAQAKCHDLQIELMAPLVCDEVMGSDPVKKSLFAPVGTTPRSPILLDCGVDRHRCLCGQQRDRIGVVRGLNRGLGRQKRWLLALGWRRLYNLAWRRRRVHQP